MAIQGSLGSIILGILEVQEKGLTELHLYLYLKLYL